jgi:hypothetical protein
MKRKVLEHVIEVCDFCNRQSTNLTSCIVCKKEYCLICRGIISGCIAMPEICKNCDNLAVVREIVEEFVKPLRAILRKRDGKISQLSEKEREG